MISINAAGEYGESDNLDCDGSDGFCDRSYELHNQLYWKGLFATKNTIGNSDKSAAEWCPDGITCSSRAEARVYDLSYLRTFHPTSGGERAFEKSDASLVIAYDARIRANPPPLFELPSESSGSELGSNLLEVLRRFVQTFSGQ